MGEYAVKAQPLSKELEVFDQIHKGASSRTGKIFSIVGEIAETEVLNMNHRRCASVMVLSLHRQLLALILLVLVSGSTIVVHGDGSLPSPVAVTYFVGDPLWGFYGANGNLFSSTPDERHAMASTTKIVTLHIAVFYLNHPELRNPPLSLYDMVTISPLAAGIGGSTMQDVNNNPLQAGEVVKFADLIRGMMYPSGNNAAYAIAEHVIPGTSPPANPNFEVNSFVGLMNEHFTAESHEDLGLTDTHFTNPAGFDNPDHYTTPRELAKIWLHAMKDDYFRQVVGFQGAVGPLCSQPVCYSFQTTLPNGATKNYSYNWGNSYPGWEGHKNGRSPNCAATRGVQWLGWDCLVFSARRIGREVVGAYMDGKQGSDMQPFLDYGFSKIFHPDKHGLGLSIGSSVDSDLECLPNGRAVSVGISSTQALKLTTWDVDVDSSKLTKLAESSFQPSAVPGTISLSPGVESAWLSNTNIVTLLTRGSLLPVLGASNVGSISLGLWSLSLDGTPHSVVNYVPVGQGRGARIIRISDTLFVTAYVASDATVVLKSWAKTIFLPGGKVPGEMGKPVTKLGNLGTLNWSSKVDELDLAPLGAVGGAYYFVSAWRRQLDGAVVNRVWSLDASTGGINAVDGVNSGVQGNSVSIAQVPVESLGADEIFQPSYFATTFRTPSGTLRILYDRVTFGFDGFQDIVTAGDTGDTGEAVSGRQAVAPLSTSGLITAVRDGNSQLKLIVWESRRNADDSISPYRIAEHTTGTDSKLVSLCGLPANPKAEGDFVSASLFPGGLLQGSLALFGWRVGDRP